MKNRQKADVHNIRFRKGQIKRQKNCFQNRELHDLKVHVYGFQNLLKMGKF